MSSTTSGDVQYSNELRIRDVSYIIAISTVKNEVLIVECEQKSTGDRWRAEFPAKYIEEMTLKSGGSRKFPVFVKMLCTCLGKRSESLFLDLLTFSDLEALKTGGAPGLGQSQRQQPGGGAGSSTNQAIYNKRYLIMTYEGEFEKLHYPLPLFFEENPDPQVLKTQIRRLREENDRLKEGQGRVEEAAALAEENDLLKQKLKKVQQAMKHKSDEEIQKLVIENDSLRSEKRDIEEAFERLRKESNREVKTIQKECEMLARDLESQTAQMETLRKKFLESGDKSVEVKQLKKQIVRLQEELEEERASARQLSTKLRKELESIAEELKRTKEAERTFRVRCREISAELESTRRRANLTLNGSRPSSVHSTPSKKTPTVSKPTNTFNSNGPSSRNSSRTSSPMSLRSNTSGGGRFDPTSYVLSQQNKRVGSGGSVGGSRSVSPQGPALPRPSSSNLIGGSNSRRHSPTSSMDSERDQRRGGVIGGGSKRSGGSGVSDFRPTHDKPPLSYGSGSKPSHKTAGSKTSSRSSTPPLPPRSSSPRDLPLDPSSLKSKLAKLSKKTIPAYSSGDSENESLRSTDLRPPPRSDRKPPISSASASAAAGRSGKSGSVSGSSRRGQSSDSESDMLLMATREIGGASRRKKISAYSSTEEESDRDVPGTGIMKLKKAYEEETRKARGASEFFDATAEMSEIDSRLNALQNFLAHKKHR